MAEPDHAPPAPRHPHGAVTPLSLLERVRARDPQAWPRLLALFQPQVALWCVRSGLRGPDVEDLTQEIFAAAAAGFDGFRRDRPGDTFRGWLSGITRNLVALHYRRLQGQVAAEGGSAAWEQLQKFPDPLAGIDGDEAAEMSALYRRALDLVRDQFEERTWQAFWLTVVEGRSPAALAAELGMSAVAIRKAKSRVLYRLKQEVGDLLG